MLNHTLQPPMHTTNLGTTQQERQLNEQSCGNWLTTDDIAEMFGTNRNHIQKCMLAYIRTDFANALGVCEHVRGKGGRYLFNPVDVESLRVEFEVDDDRFST